MIVLTPPRSYAMIRLKESDESLLRLADREELSAEPMSNGDGPYLYENPPYYTASVWVCGSHQNSDANDVWVSIVSEKDFREPHDWCLQGLSPAKALSIGNRLASVHRHEGDPALVREAKRLGLRPL